MISAKTGYILKLAFSPLIIFLSILYISFLVWPYDYFNGKELTNIIAVLFPVCLVILLPIDLLLKAFLVNNVKRLWYAEALILLLVAVIGLLVTL